MTSETTFMSPGGQAFISCDTPTADQQKDSKFVSPTPVTQPPIVFDLNNSMNVKGETAVNDGYAKGNISIEIKVEAIGDPVLDCEDMEDVPPAYTSQEGKKPAEVDVSLHMLVNGLIYISFYYDFCLGGCKNNMHKIYLFIYL